MGIFDSIKKLFSGSEKQEDTHSILSAERAERMKIVAERAAEREKKDTNKVEQTPKEAPSQAKYIRYKISDFQEEFKGNITVAPENFMLKLFDAEAKGEEFIDVPVSVLNKIQKNKEKDEKWNKTYNDIMSNSTAGQKAEKDEDIDKAISFYKEAISIGEKSKIEIFHAYANPYKRLFVLLHKQKRIGEEIGYLKTFLNHDLSESERIKYQERLNKLDKDNVCDQTEKRTQSNLTVDTEKQCFEILSNIRAAADMHKMENFSKAIAYYKDAIKIGENCKVDMFNTYSAAYKCLITLLDQQYKYDEEKLYIDAYLTHDISENERAAYTDILNRLNEK